MTGYHVIQLMPFNGAGIPSTFYAGTKGGRVFLAMTHERAQRYPTNEAAAKAATLLLPPQGFQNCNWGGRYIPGSAETMQ